MAKHESWLLTLGASMFICAATDTQQRNRKLSFLCLSGVISAPLIFVIYAMTVLLSWSLLTSNKNALAY